MGREEISILLAGSLITKEPKIFLSNIRWIRRVGWGYKLVRIRVWDQGGGLEVRLTQFVSTGKFQYTIILYS